MSQYSDDQQIAEESYDECIKHLDETNRFCPVCEGSGYYVDGPTNEPEQVQCRYCLGTGMLS